MVRKYVRLRNGQRWEKYEISALKRYYGNMPIEFIAYKLERSESSVRGKAKNLGLATRRLVAWSEDDVSYLKKNFGIIPVKQIAEDLGRTINAIRLKANELGLSAANHDSVYTISDICDAFSISKSTFLRFMATYDIPHSQDSRGWNVFRPEDIWAWAEENKDKINWKKYKVKSLHSEPKWVKTAIKQCKVPKKRCDAYTAKEIAQIIEEKRAGMGYKEIAEKHHRSVSAVKTIWLKKERYGLD